MRKILCIVRSSTVAQEIETQKKELIEFARTKGYDDDDMVPLFQSFHTKYALWRQVKKMEAGSCRFSGGDLV